MANSYSAPNCLIDTDTTLSAFETATGHTVTTADVIFVHTGATLTVDVARPFLIAKHGETSTGDPGAGNRRGNITFNANITTTYGGNATATNSGLKSSPAAPGTETKSNTLTILGTAAQPTVFTNSAGAYSATARYCINWVYGVFGTMGVWTFNYPSPATSGWSFCFPATSTYTTSSEHNLGRITHASGAFGATNHSLIVHTYAGARTIPVVIEDADLNYTGATAGRAGLLYYAYFGNAAATDDAAFTVKRRKITNTAAAGSNNENGAVLLLCVAAGSVWYVAAERWAKTDIRATQVVPTGLAIADAGTDGELDISWSNGASYAAGDKLVVYNAAGDAVLAILDATVGSGKIAGLTNGTAYTVYAKATSDNSVYSTASATSAAATPTGSVVSVPGKPSVSLGSTGATVDGDAGVTNYVYYRKDGADQGWTLLGSRSGDGIVLYGSLAEGSYLFMALSKSGDSWSQASDAKRYYVGGSTRTLDHRVWLDCAAALDAASALKPLFIDREECKVMEIVRGKLPSQRLPYLGAEWSGEQNDLDTETDYATGRLVISLLLKDEPRKGKQWDLDRWVKIIVQTLAADETRGDLVFKWRYRGTETPGGIIAPLRVARLTFEYEHAPVSAARVSV